MIQVNQGRTVYEIVSTLATAIDRDAPITLMLVFSRVAASGPAGVFQNAVQRELGLTPATMSRAVLTLSEMHYSKSKPGLGLITRSMNSAKDGETAHPYVNREGTGTVQIWGASPCAS